nr:hypothetical protein [Xanthomonadaceae bacterium]
MALRTAMRVWSPSLLQAYCRRCGCAAPRGMGTSMVRPAGPWMRMVPSMDPAVGCRTRVVPSVLQVPRAWKRRSRTSACACVAATWAWPLPPAT